MVEKFTSATSLAAKADSNGTGSATGGILKKVARSLDTVSENNEISSLEHRDSGESLSNEKTHNGVEEETEKFKTLCEGVQNQLALFQVSMAELLALKDELLTHALPPSLLVKIALVTSKLFRGASDFAVPVNELVRLVKLYSAPWESKSAALKKLHEDYENKQRQLNVALQKLVLVGIQADRMAQERKVLNWERLFTRIMTSKAHGYRWKFLIESFKKKIKTGEIYEAGASTDEEVQQEKEKNERKLEHIRRRTLHKITTPQRIMKEVVTIDGAKQSLASSDEKSPVKADVTEEELLSDIDIEDEKPVSRESSAEQQSRKEIKSSSHQLIPSKPDKPKIRFNFKPPSDDDDDDDDSDDDKPRGSLLQFKPSRQLSVVKKPGRVGMKFNDEKPRSKPKPQKSISAVKFFDPSDDEEDDVKTKQQAPPIVTVPKVVTEDKQCWTHEPDCERFLHIRLYRPICKKADEPCCTVVFMGKALKTSSYEPPPSTPEQSDEENKPEEKISDVKGKPGKGSKVSIKTSETSTKGKQDEHENQPETNSPVEQIPRFEELLFKLPDTNGYAPGKKPVDISDEQIKFAVHPSYGEPMVAMAAVKYSELKVLDQFEGRWSHTDYANEIQKFPLMSTLSDRDMPFGSDCGHIPIVCYMSKVESPKIMSKETETESFERLVHNEIVEIRKAEEQEREEATRGVSPPVYTESEVQSLRDMHTEEIQALHSEYEKRLNELAQGLDAYSGNEEMREFVHAATSPLLLRSPSSAQSSSPTRRSQSATRSHTSLSHVPSQTPLQQQQQQIPRPPTDGRLSSRKARPKVPNLPAWGKDLPQDFMVRLDMFNENSEKYRIELEEKTKRAIQQKYELQMAVQNRLSIPEDERLPQEEVCLPAVFMPTKTGLVFSAKAHSYFHPPGSSEGRLTQPPSMFKLPHLGEPNQVSVLNLLNTGQRYIVSQSEKIPNSPVPQTAPPLPTSFDMESSFVHPGRACTR